MSLWLREWDSLRLCDDTDLRMMWSRYRLCGFKPLFFFSWKRFRLLTAALARLKQQRQRERVRLRPRVLCLDSGFSTKLLNALTVVSPVRCRRRRPCWWEWEGSAGGDCGNEGGWCLPGQEKERGWRNTSYSLLNLKKWFFLQRLYQFVWNK